jgi:hypothetical protein
MHVDTKPEQVTSYFVDSSFTPPGMTMEAVYESPEVVGNSYEWTVKMLGMPRKGVTVYTEYVPGERVAFRNFGALEGTSTWTVEPEEGGSKATVDWDAHLAIPVIGRLLDPILRREFEKNLKWGKREMERQPKVN